VAPITGGLLGRPTYPRAILTMLGLAVAYAMLGRLSLLLAIPPAMRRRSGPRQALPWRGSWRGGRGCGRASGSGHFWSISGLPLRPQARGHSSAADDGPG
jgi:hypothetical protein